MLLRLCAWIAGQWKFAQDRLKLQWAEQEDSKTLLNKLSGKQDSMRSNAAAVAGSETTWDVLAEAPVDPLTGKLPLLLGAEELDKQFWSGSKPGRAMLEQVRVEVAYLLLYTLHRGAEAQAGLPASHAQDLQLAC
jgi:hypothetical protein